MITLPSFRQRRQYDGIFPGHLIKNRAVPRATNSALRQGDSLLVLSLSAIKLGLANAVHDSPVNGVFISQMASARHKNNTLCFQLCIVSVFSQLYTRRIIKSRRRVI